MIMISDITLNNVTERAVPAWMANDNFAELMNREEEKAGLFSRLHTLLKK